MSTDVSSGKVDNVGGGAFEEKLAGEKTGGGAGGTLLLATSNVPVALKADLYMPMLKGLFILMCLFQNARVARAWCECRVRQLFKVLLS